MVTVTVTVSQSKGTSVDYGTVSEHGYCEEKGPEVQNLPKNKKSPHPPPRKFSPKNFPTDIFSTPLTDHLHFTQNVSRKENMATFCSLCYCSYDIGILSTCSFLERFKTIEQDEANLNRRCCSVSLKKIPCFSFSREKQLSRQNLMNGSVGCSDGAFQCNITCLSKDA